MSTVISRWWHQYRAAIESGHGALAHKILRKINTHVRLAG